MNIRFQLVVGLGALVAATRAMAFCSYFPFSIGPSQVAPPGTGAGGGDAALFLCDDQMLTGTITVQTSETITALHIHGPAGMSEIGPELFALPLPVGDHLVVNLGPLTPEQVLLIEQQETYLDVHSVEHPGGVLRGQVWHEVAVTPSAWSQVKSLYRE